MQREYKVYLKDILEAIRKIERYSKDVSFEDVKKDYPDHVQVE